MSDLIGGRFRLLLQSGSCAKNNSHRSSLSGAGLQADLMAETAANFADQVQAHSGRFMVLASTLTRKIGIKYPFLIFRGNADALIRNFKDDILVYGLCRDGNGFA
ncbi:hypothetical protein D3C74_332920 [compost metagenome]